MNFNPFPAYKKVYRIVALMGLSRYLCDKNGSVH